MPRLHPWLRLLLAPCLVIALFTAGGVGASAESPSSAALLAAAADAWRVGDADTAVRQWGEAIRLSRIEHDRQTELDALAQRGEALAAAGRLPEAEADLETGLARARALQRKVAEAALLGALGNVAFQSHDLVRASDLLDASVSTARSIGAGRILAASLNNKGDVLASRGDPDAARRAYLGADEAAAAAEDALLQETIAVNLARVAAQRAGDAAKDGKRTESDSAVIEAKASLAKAVRIANMLPPSRERIVGLVAIVRIGLSLPRSGGATSDGFDLPALEALARETAANSDEFHDLHGQSLAAGTLAEVLESEAKRSEAGPWARRAIEVAQRAQANDLIWRWEWLNGRLAAAAGDDPRAIAAYRRAGAVLADLPAGSPIGDDRSPVSFRKHLGPLYFGMLDLLLAEAGRQGIGEPRRAVLLAQALTTIEQFESNEVADFFHNPCVRPEERLLDSGHDYLGTHDAVLYPILRPDHIDLLLSLPGATPREPRRLVFHSVLVSQAKAVEVIHRLRGELEILQADPETPARQLYDWLIRPVWDEITKTGADTLVVVPDGILRTIPFAALQDRDDYLIQSIAILTEPSVTLAGRYNEQVSARHVLLAGTSEKITYTNPPLQPLPSVNLELDFLHHIYPQADSLRDQSFTVETLRNALRHVPYNVVHIAAHAVFGDSPEQTYFFTHDGAFSLDMLEASLGTARLQSTPLDMLVLSACATADGNDATALGLAGVGVKAGARTAIGALWSVDGEVAARLMQQFYTYLSDASLTKARAFRLAELDILQQSRRHSPYAWAPFLMIGSGR